MYKEIQGLAKKYKTSILFLGGVFMLILLGVILVPKAWQEVDRAYPFLSERYPIYGQFTSGIDREDWPFVEQSLLDSFVSEEYQPLLEALYQSSGTKKGFFMGIDGFFVFTEGEFFLKDQSKYSFKQYRVNRYDQEYKVLTFDMYEDVPQWDVSVLLQKQAFLQQSSDYLMQFSLVSKETPLFGGLTLSSNGIAIHFLGKDQKITPKPIELPTISFVSEQTGNEGVTHLNELLLPEKQALLEYLVVSGSLYYDGPTPLQSNEQLFLSENWSYRGSIDENQAKNLLITIGEFLSELYPQAIPRLLPDDSQVFELVQNSDRFFLEGEDWDIQNGLITYTNGQIKYSYVDGVLELVQGELNQAELSSSTCHFEGAMLVGRELYTQNEASLWKSSSFALGSQRAVVCFSPRPQVIHINE